MSKRKPINWTTFRLKLADLVPWESNPRVLTERDAAKIRTSLQDFGVVDPLVANHDRVSLIGGHMRRLLLLQDGVTEADVRIPDRTLKPAEARRLALTLNRVHAEWDWDKIANEFEIPELLDAGFDAGEFEAEPESQSGDDTPAREAKEVPRVARTGDLWLLGRHRVLCGDSFKADDVAKLTESQSVQVVLMDPPYAIYGSSTGVASDVADDKMVRPFFEQMFKTALAALDRFGHCYVHCDWRSWAAVWQGAKDGASSKATMTCKNCLVWDKGGSGLGSNYANTHELVGFFAKIPKSGVMRTGKEQTGQRAVLAPNILRFNRPSGDDRPVNAAKPVALLEELLRNSSDEGGRVLDLFAGSGSTLIAAERSGRIGLGMEMEPQTVDILLDRWQRETGEQAVLTEGTGSMSHSAAVAKRSKRSK